MEGTCSAQEKNLLTVEVRRIVQGVIVPIPTSQVPCSTEDAVEMRAEDVDPLQFKSLKSMAQSENRFV